MSSFSIISSETTQKNGSPHFEMSLFEREMSLIVTSIHAQRHVILNQIRLLGWAYSKQAIAFTVFMSEEDEVA